MQSPPPFSFKTFSSPQKNTLYLLNHHSPFPHHPNSWKLLKFILSLWILDISHRNGKVLCISLKFVINMTSFILGMKYMISITIQPHSNEFEFAHHNLFCIFNVTSYYCITIFRTFLLSNASGIIRLRYEKIKAQRKILSFTESFSKAIVSKVL